MIRGAADHILDSCLGTSENLKPESYRGVFRKDGVMKKLFGAVLLGLGVLTVASAGIPFAPEIDAGSSVNALALIAGAVLVVRGRRRK